VTHTLTTATTSELDEVCVRQARERERESERGTPTRPDFHFVAMQRIIPAQLVLQRGRPTLPVMTVWGRASLRVLRYGEWVRRRHVVFDI